MILLNTLLMSTHLLAMNLASGGPLVAVFLASPRHSVDQAGRRLVWVSAAALVVGCVLGGGLLLTRGTGVSLALGRFPTQAYWYAAAEIVFSAGCILALPALWKLRVNRRWRWPAMFLIALASTTNLLYHFPPLMSVFGHLVVDPAWTSLEVLHRRDLLPLMARPSIVAMTVHFALASLTVACLGGTAILRCCTETDRRDDVLRRAARRLLFVAAGLTVAQFGVGLWLVVATDASERNALLGGAWLPTASFAGGLLAAMKLAERIVVAALDDCPEIASRCAERWLVATVLLMTTALLTGR
ncbi:hypothetical protein OAS39_00080 [Pirellulales bacterium]|nr:hypothetical protein [Pirellulales bacterium]